METSGTDRTPVSAEATFIALFCMLVPVIILGVVACLR